MKKALILSLALAALTAGSVQAQDPDLREIRPVVLLLVDTSGSMERMAGGTDLPMCSGTAGAGNEHNRWTTVLEALTGSWEDASFSCTSVARTDPSSPDFGYFLPYHQPPSTPQMNDGILDVYIDRIKFGLMTFDSIYTFTDADPLLVPQTVFQGRLADNVTALGGFSYADQRPLTYPGGVTTFMVDSGARNENAAGGALVSVGAESVDHRAINTLIQAQLLAARPYGGSPTASVLHDARWYFANNSDITGDPYASCRPRYVILVTDGAPDEDFRDASIDCDAVDGCPYDLSTEIVADMCRYSGASCGGNSAGVFVVAFDVTDTAALAELDAIADVGGTGEALRASTRTELLARISEALDRAQPGTTTRTRPAFITSGTTFVDGPASQLQFTTGFRIGTPWNGILERTRYLCSDSLAPEPEPVSQRVRFDKVLNERTSARRLLTVVTSNAADMTRNLIGTDRASVPLGADLVSGTITNMSLTNFDNTISPAHFGITSTGAAATTLRDHIVDWVHGRTSDRQHAKMGDIYHSNPVVVGPPRLDIADESYNLFRQRTDVVNRPTIVYVGTNDGVLHAFVAENWRSADGSQTYAAGDELWGYIPPVLVPKLESAAASHQIMVDGTPVVRDIFYRRLATDQPSGSIYHTVLIMGYRDGAVGYFALDVTDPLNPRFLWQFVGDLAAAHGHAQHVTPRGYSYARPGIGQVLIEINGTLQERAIALLPGGAGVLDEEAVRTTGPVGCPGQGVGQPPTTGGTGNARSHQRCWTNRGRILTWVDVVTGEIIDSFGSETFNAPLTGGVALYPGDVGAVAERAFLTDADGVVWAIDFSNRRPSQWSARPFHDLFWDDEATEGQPAYDPPVVSVDTSGNIVVLVGTGDIDRLDGTFDNRVVSLTENRTVTSGTPSYSTTLNWQIRLRPGEQMTGPIELFQRTAYFATFESGTTASNACSIGQSRIWAVDYRQSNTSAASGYTAPVRFPLPRLETTAGSGVFNRHFNGPFADQLILGVGVTQRPTCVTGVDEIDPYIGSRFQVTGSGGGTFELIAQVSGGVRNGSSGAVSITSMAVPSPQSFTRLNGFAGRVDY